MKKQSFIVLKSGLTILQPAAVIAVGDHGETGAAIYTAGGAIVVTDSADDVLAALNDDAAPADDAAGVADAQADHTD